MKRGVFLGVVSVLVLVSIFQVSAGFILGNKSADIDTSYSPNEIVRGWINISLQQEPASSILSSNFGGNTSLAEFLWENDADYTCVPADCESDYSLTIGQTRKNVSMSFGEERVIAINLSGTIASVSNFSISFNVSNSLSCIKPFEIDFLDDGELDWESWKFSSDFTCTYEYGTGCFENSAEVSEVNITDKQFCEKIKIIQSDKFKVGGWVKRVGAVAGLKMELIGTGGGAPLASCQLPVASTSGEEVDCVIYYNNTQMNDYYVCISSNVSNSYATKFESVNPCGFFAVSSIPPAPDQPKFDYYLFARGARFSRVGEIVYNQREYEKINGGEINSEIMNYLRGRYADSCSDCAVNCTRGCAVPIKIKSYGTMSIDASNAIISFTTYSGGGSANQIYDSVKISPRISSGFLKLDLEYAPITLPSIYGNQTLNLLLGGQQIFSKPISIARIPIIRDVFPRIMPAAIEGTITASVYSPANKSIVSYFWDFGDDTSEETETNSVRHAYPSTGAYTLTLEVEDEDGLTSSKEFSMIVGNPQQIVNSTIKKYRARINNLTRQIEAEVSWQKKIIEDFLDIDELNSKLTGLERKFSLAESDEDYVSIMANLSEMNIPSYLKKSSLGNFPVLLDTDEINFDDLGQYDEDYLGTSSEDETVSVDIGAYGGAVSKWYSENIEASADYYMLFAYFDTDIQTVFTYYKLKITALDPKEEEAYLIISQNVNVNPQETIKEFDDSVGIKFYKLEDKELEFVLVGESNPFDIQVYIAPEFRKLDTNLVLGVCNFNKRCESDRNENWKNCRNDCRPWGWAIFYTVLLLFIAFISYIVLQEWYKRRYENYLFKNRNDLYNIVNFVNNSLVRGMSHEEIIRNLKKAGWNSEQVSYAMKKIKGKRVGMPLELGIPKIKKKDNNLK
ncbi:MAG: PKD domain-containing protein [Nanoarchaeota archaeon]|nr:PKD domain-containing protein [Nanoarchaeota archaeon]